MSKLKNLFVASFPEEAASQAAYSRLAEQALEQDRKPSRTRSRLPLRLSLGVAVAALAVGAIVMAPTISMAMYLRTVRQAIKDAKSAHWIEYRITQDGRQKKTRELWYQDGKWRTEWLERGSVSIRDGFKSWEYIPDRRTVRVKPDSDVNRGQSGFTLTSMIADAGGRNKFDIKTEGPLERVTITNPIDHAIITIWVDKKTDYPIRGQVASQTPNGVQVQAVMEIEFNKKLPESLFTANFPSGTKVLDMSQGKAFWERELSKQIGAIEVPKSMQFPVDRIVIRNVQVGERGDVYLLYTGSLDHTGFTLTDDLGTVYAPCEGFQAASYSMEQGKPGSQKNIGIEIDGLAINGGWWTPVNPQTQPWKARKLTFSAAQNGYKVDPEKMKGMKKGSMVKFSEMIPVSTPIGQWSVSIAAPTYGIVADFAPFMGQAPEDELEADKCVAEARVRYLLAHGRFAAAEVNEREEIRLIGELERTSGFRWVQSREFYRMYVCLKGQGKTAEARTWLAKVQDEPDGAHGDQDIEKALKAEGF